MSLIADAIVSYPVVAALQTTRFDITHVSDREVMAVALNARGIMLAA